MKQFKKQLLTASAIVGLASALSAQVVLDASATFTVDPDSNELVRQDTYTFVNGTDFTLNPTSSDKLVVAFGSENAGGIDSITFGGVSMTQALYRDDSKEIAIFYLDNPATNGDLFINPTSSSVNGVGGAIFALSNTELGFGQTSDSAGGSTTLTATAGSFVLAIAAKNQGTPPEAQSPLTGVFSSGSGSSATGVGYQVPGSSGSLTPTFNNSPELTGAVEFTAVPEPGSFALLAGCFGLTWVMLRRRA